MSIPTSPLALEGIGFKGDRDYLHGTDILPVALNTLSGGQPPESITDIDIVFHALVRTGLTLQTDAPIGGKPNVQLSCTMGGERRKFFLMENGRSIKERRPYPEEQIVEATTIDIDAATASSRAYLPFTSIERWIAMIKALHHAVYPAAEGKWLFARGKLASYRDTYEGQLEHRASIQSNFGGKLTRSAVTIDGRMIGDIFFVLT